jgi:hypothetical protein
MWYTKPIRTFILCAVMVFPAAHITIAQSYYHTPGDTVIANAAFNDVNVFNIMQVHPTADTLYFKWYMQSVVMPASWEASICDNGNCYTSLRDSGMMNPIVPGDNGLMSLHLDPKNEAGTGIIRYTIFDTLTPQQVDTLTWIITASGPTGIPGKELLQPVAGTRHGRIWCRNINPDFNTAVLYDMNGRILFRQRITGKEIDIPAGHFSPGILILKLSGKKIFLTKILNQ